MAAYPVTFNIERPEKFARTQIFIRLGLLIVVAILEGLLVGRAKPSYGGWISGVLYIIIPLAAAILISQKGAEGYLAGAEGNMTKWLRILVAVHAYLALLTDRLPNEDARQTLQFDVQPTGRPSAGKALLRIILVIPHAIVLAILGLIGFMLVIIAGFMILVRERYPAGIYNFLVGITRWNARVYAYLASLVAEYPPFSLDTGSQRAVLDARAPTQTRE